VNFLLLASLLAQAACKVLNIHVIKTAASSPVPAYCKNCKYMMVENTKNKINHIQYGKCLLYPIRKNEDYHMVTGSHNTYAHNDIQEMIDRVIDYEYCVSVRKNENKCGRQGIYFENNLDDNDIDLNFF